MSNQDDLISIGYLKLLIITLVLSAMLRVFEYIFSQGNVGTSSFTGIGISIDIPLIGDFIESLIDFLIITIPGLPEPLFIIINLINFILLTIPMVIIINIAWKGFSEFWPDWL